MVCYGMTVLRNSVSTVTENKSFLDTKNFSRILLVCVAALTIKIVE